MKGRETMKSRSETFGDATIHLCDAREMRQHLEERSIDLLWTDPPYGNENNGKGLTRDTKHWRGNDDKAHEIANDDLAATKLTLNGVMERIAGLGDELSLMKRESAVVIMTAGGGPTPTFAWDPTWSPLLADAR